MADDHRLYRERLADSLDPEADIEVVAGATYVSPPLAEEMAAQMLYRPGWFDALSEDERQIVRLIAGGSQDGGADE